MIGDSTRRGRNFSRRWRCSSRNLSIILSGHSIKFCLKTGGSYALVEHQRGNHEKRELEEQGEQGNAPSLRLSLSFQTGRGCALSFLYYQTSSSRSSLFARTLRWETWRVSHLEFHWMDDELATSIFKSFQSFCLFMEDIVRLCWRIFSCFGGEGFLWESWMTRIN